MQFRKWLNENSEITFADPTGQGLTITASIDLVPGETGKGQYVGFLSITPKSRIGGVGVHTKFQHSFEAAQTALRELLQNTGNPWLRKYGLDRHGLPAWQVHKITKPKLVYTGWGKNSGLSAKGYAGNEPEEEGDEILKKMPGYDPEEHKRAIDFANKIYGTVKQVKDDWDREQLLNPKQFGEQRPERGEYLTKDDIALIPDVIEKYGDFDVVIKWAKRERQRTKASDLYKHYDKITADAEVKTGDYIREIWVV